MHLESYENSLTSLLLIADMFWMRRIIVFFWFGFGFCFFFSFSFNCENCSCYIAVHIKYINPHQIHRIIEVLVGSHLWRPPNPALRLSGRTIFSTRGGQPRLCPAESWKPAKALSGNPLQCCTTVVAKKGHSKLPKLWFVPWFTIFHYPKKPGFTVLVAPLQVIRGCPPSAPLACSPVIACCH